MRDIKFRGKEIDSGEWVYGDYRHMLTNGTHWIINDEKFGNSMFQVIPETISQFTGLKDRHGNEIYDGDIVKAVKHENYPATNVVIWRSGILWFGNWNWIEFQNVFRNLEVVGNASDNPELLNT